ncbi:MAG: response regulator [Bacteroidia bacterium]
MIKIIIADDHSIIRDGLRAMLEKNNFCKIVGEAANGEELLELLKSTPCDIVCTDISMPKMDGVEATRLIVKNFPKVKVMCLSMHEEAAFIKQMMEAGAVGYVFKDSPSEELQTAIEAVNAGKKYFNQKLFDILLNMESSGKTVSVLSSREKEILKLIAEEYTNPEIAEKLFLSVRTVDTHRQNLIQKLDVKNTAGLVKYAIKSGLI